jgi:hypothetical protein
MGTRVMNLKLALGLGLCEDVAFRDNYVSFYDIQRGGSNGEACC